MADLYINVWETANAVALGDVKQTQSVTIGASSAQSSAVWGTSPKRMRVRLYAESDCFVMWGSDPTASSSDGVPLGADQKEYFDIQAGYLVAVIERT